MMQRMMRQAVLVGAAMIGGAMAAPVQAQVTIDFRTTNGGFTTQNIVGNNPWTWTNGIGWRVNGSTTVAQSRLLSPVLTAAGGAFSVDARHLFNFEDVSPTACFDGGVVFASINGGAFQQLAPSAGRAYSGPISANFQNPLAGRNAFCGNSGGIVSSVFTANLTAGTTIRLALDGAWDNSFAEANPNWLLQSVTINGLQQQPPNVVPEPSTYALLAAGLGGVGFIARRRRSA